MALGSPGGSRIIGYVFNVLVNTLDYGMDVQSAVNAPRIVARNGSVSLDDALQTPALQAGLEARGFSVGGTNTGSVQAIIVGDDGMLYGAADPRRNGLALGQ
jgi:gamma-glutamyltranspeptidase/glutathione hydrolase